MKLRHFIHDIDIWQTEFYTSSRHTHLRTNIHTTNKNTHTHTTTTNNNSHSHARTLSFSHTQHTNGIYRDFDRKNIKSYVGTKNASSCFFNLASLEMTLRVYLKGVFSSSLSSVKLLSLPLSLSHTHPLSLTHTLSLSYTHTLQSKVPHFTIECFLSLEKGFKAL